MITLIDNVTLININRKTDNRYNVATTIEIYDEQTTKLKVHSVSISKEYGGEDGEANF